MRLFNGNAVRSANKSLCNIDAQFGQPCVTKFGFRGGIIPLDRVR